MPRVVLVEEVATLIDSEDADLIDGHSWWVSGVPPHRYVQCKIGRDGKYSNRYLHRLIGERVAGNLDGLVIDHINGDTLDNRRENLRAVTQRENLRNRGGATSRSKTGHLGVGYREGRPRPYHAYLAGRRGNYKSLGHFATLDEAVAARLAAEKELWGIQPRRAEQHGEAA